MHSPRKTAMNPGSARRDGLREGVTPPELDSLGLLADEHEEGHHHEYRDDGRSERERVPVVRRKALLDGQVQRSQEVPELVRHARVEAADASGD